MLELDACETGCACGLHLNSINLNSAGTNICLSISYPAYKKSVNMSCIMQLYQQKFKIIIQRAHLWVKRKKGNENYCTSLTPLGN